MGNRDLEVMANERLQAETVALRLEKEKLVEVCKLAVTYAMQIQPHMYDDEGWKLNQELLDKARIAIAKEVIKDSKFDGDGAGEENEG